MPPPPCYQILVLFFIVKVEALLGETFKSIFKKTNIYLSLICLFYAPVCLSLGGSLDSTVRVCGQRTAWGGQFSPSTPWAPEIDLLSPGLAAGTFTHQPICWLIMFLYLDWCWGKWWSMHAVPTLQRLRQEDCWEFKASLCYRVRLCFKEKSCWTWLAFTSLLLNLVFLSSQMLYYILAPLDCVLLNSL